MVVTIQHFYLQMHRIANRLLPHFVKYAELPYYVKYVESQSRSDCSKVTVAKRLLWGHSRKATVMPRRRGEAASI